MSVAPLEFSLDKPLPQNPEAERSVLGSILIDNGAYYRVAAALRPEDFYRDAHRIIFAIFTELAGADRPIDVITLKDELTKRALLDQVGGGAYVSSLVDGIPDIGNVEHYGRIIKEKSTLRRLIVMGNEVIKAASDVPGEATEVLGKAETSIFKIAEDSLERGFVSITDITPRQHDLDRCVAEHRQAGHRDSNGLRPLQ